MGVGYSYAEDKELIPDSMEWICSDLIDLLVAFMERHPEYQVSRLLFHVLLFNICKLASFA